ncbi:hypothetical protein BX666DRAFT_2006865 [Dichotomocladium elegans]|nr:hypothetical protein BX666DRAFT_2006865 [Dichotomocladium elegans]
MVCRASVLQQPLIPLTRLSLRLQLQPLCQRHLQKKKTISKSSIDGRPSMTYFILLLHFFPKANKRLTPRFRYASGILGSQQTVFDAKDQPLVSRASMNNGNFRTRRNSTPHNIMLAKQRPLSLILQRTCTHCNQRLRLDTQSFLENGNHYCKKCHTDLFAKGTCPVCEKLVFPHRDTFIDHKTTVWHKECFRCHECLVDISDMPVVDLRGRPCCERCLMAQAETPQKEDGSKLIVAKVHVPQMPPQLISSTASTPTLTKQRNDSVSSAGSLFSVPGTPPPSRPRIDSQLFQHYQKSFHQPPELASSPPPLSPAGSIRSSRSCSPLSISPSTSPLSIQSRPTPPPLQTTSQKAFSVAQQVLLHEQTTALPPQPDQHTGSRRMCAECKKPLKGTRAKLPSATGDVWYHYSCLKCAGCQDAFKDSKFATFQNHIYHRECVPRMNSQDTRSLACHSCRKSIRDKFISCSARSYHPECFQCHSCHKTLSHEQPYFEVGQEPHCEACANRSKPPTPRPFPSRRTSSTSTPILSTQRSYDHPSSLLMHRTRALPKLGGSTYCPRCRKSVPITDDVPGPNATRWHKKCLRCIGCNKQMDSGAKAIGDDNRGYYVQCRMCTDNDRDSQKYVR